MGFSETDKLKALAIVHIFETGRPLGVYGSVAVLDDGAGISYGINQFTHKSGNLEAVIRRYRKLVGEDAVLDEYIDPASDLCSRSAAAIALLSGDAKFKKRLRELGKNEMMQRAQREIAFEKFLRPAVEACEGSNFKKALSLAVIYDSQVHGSWGKIRDRVKVSRAGHTDDESFEKAWIAEYAAKRDAWLESIPRLKKTDYRTDFFLAQIGRGNWDLNLPMNVNGYRLEEEDIYTTHAAEPRQTPQDDLPKDRQQLAAAPPQAEAQNPVPEPQNPNSGSDAGDMEKMVNAPAPTGFLAKLKLQIASLGIGAGSLGAVKEIFGITLSAETMELLKILIPTVLGLGFLGFLVWYVSEKVVGFKTLKMQSEIATDPTRHDLKIVGRES